MHLHRPCVWLCGDPRCCDESNMQRSLFRMTYMYPWLSPCTTRYCMRPSVWLPFNWNLDERKLCTSRFTRKTSSRQSCTLRAGSPIRCLPGGTCPVRAAYAELRDS